MRQIRGDKMRPQNGQNEKHVSYFPLEEYVKRIRVSDFVLEHMEDTNHQFDAYLKLLSQYDNYSVIYYFIDSLSKEIKSSQQIERHHIKNMDFLNSKVFFETLQINHNQIKKTHQFVTESDEKSEYRKKDVRVSKIYPDGKEDIFWWGVNKEDVKPFMDDFIKFYKSNSLSVLNANPFLKSALVHLLFVRIHPFTDGNGRCARTLHNIKFTEAINKAYNMKLKICPLNLSQNILINKPTYAKRINNIYFDLEHDSNDEINEWFDFMLNMVDEQLYFSMNRIPKLEKAFQNIAKLKDTDTSCDVYKQAQKMKIKV